ncbi:16S rRNA (uracil(1498)-N(3))-methyltransferase [Caminibacter sp.]
MQYLYFPQTSSQIIITGENHKYLFKVRRIKKGENIKIRNLKDDYLYIYEIKDINKKEAIAFLKDKILKPQKPHSFLHLGWCIIEPKNIEKTLPSLNEIGVGKISFIYCDYSQRNFKLKLERLQKILINSNQQCGRSDLMEIEILNSSREFFEKYPKFTALDFDGNLLQYAKNFPKIILIGPEGGFSVEERKYFKEKIRLKGFILRSETAACAISSKLLL